jgi:hypothetical protein
MSVINTMLGRLILGATLAVLLLASQVQAEGKTIAWENWDSEHCKLLWPYADEQAKLIAGFRLYRTNPGRPAETLGTRAPLEIADPSARSVPCTALGVNKPGQLYLAIAAYGVDGYEAPRSPVLAFVLAPPGIVSPVRLEIILAP